jgi:hypothetical protein
MAIWSADVEPRFGQAFDSCIASALIGIAPVTASGYYMLDVRMHLCIGPDGGP